MESVLCLIAHLPQAARFHILMKEGKISPSVVKKWDDASRGLKLPKHVKDKPKISNLKRKK